MPRKNILPYQIESDKSLAASFTSTPTVITFTDNISYQINCYTSDSIGTFALEVSNDYVVDSVTGSVKFAGTWNPLDLGGGTPFVNGDDAVISISLNQVPFGAIRVAYTSSVAGTGTCDIFFLSKQLGG